MPDHDGTEEPTTAGCLGLLATMLLMALVVFVVADWLFTSNKAASACPSGVAKIEGHLSVRDLVYYDVWCVNGHHHRVN